MSSIPPSKTTVHATYDTALWHTPAGLQCAESLEYPPDLQVRVAKLAAGSGINTRTVVAPPVALTYVAELEAPGERARRWETHAPVLAVAAARDALARWRHGGVQDITHVVTHSCTGMSAPGIDGTVIAELGLASSTRKIGVNFMGCFGGFTAMYVAKQIVEADATERAVVLIVCAETCSVHMSRDQRIELVVGNTIFGDGAAAAIVARAGFRGRGASSAPCEPDIDAGKQLSHEWVIGAMSSEILPDSAGAMTWRTGAEPGQYEMWLDRSIPKTLSSMFATRGFGMLSRVGIPSAYSCAWAIHPGGKAIIKAFEEAFSFMRIKGDGLDCSKEVLHDYGNMSSPTIFFVLQRVLARTERDDVFTAGFGPGLTIEFARLSRWRGLSATPRTPTSPAPAVAANTIEQLAGASGDGGRVEPPLADVDLSAAVAGVNETSTEASDSPDTASEATGSSVTSNVAGAQSPLSGGDAN